jgi:hypothetical protein
MFAPTIRDQETAIGLPTWYQALFVDAWKWQKAGGQKGHQPGTATAIT